MAVSDGLGQRVITAIGDLEFGKELNTLLNIAQVLSSTEAGYLDGVVAGTVTAGKAVVTTIGKLIDELDITTLKIGGTAIAATALEINRVCDPTGRIVNAAASDTAIALTPAAHADRILLVPIITSAGLTITLPAATGTGDKYTVINNGIQTLSLTVTALAGDIFFGKAIGWSLTAGANDTFIPTAADIKYTFNITTTGGDGGDVLTAIDIATDKWWVNVEFHGSGTLATGFA